ncbi:hypothetical protein MKL09_00005, partial [Methylobacterium sp. J-048]|uniref:hypothetical protein n=1 Tax=Methylobacterium sp. J-048 TaxID=2836635 RepID=UPI001FBBC823
MMKRVQTRPVTVVAVPAHIAPTVADEATASVIVVLQVQLALAREVVVPWVAGVDVSTAGQGNGPQSASRKLSW